MEKVAKKYKQRLRILADFMKTVPEKRFNIESWTTGEFCGKDKEPKHNECGTAACVGGWAGTIPQFKRAGLTLTNTGDDVGSLEPAFENVEGFEALEQFFGLENIDMEGISGEVYHYDALHYIFDADNKNSAKDAVRRIENVLKVIESKEQLLAIKA